MYTRSKAKEYKIKKNDVSLKIIEDKARTFKVCEDIDS